MLAAVPADVDRATFEALAPLLMGEVNVAGGGGLGRDLVRLRGKPNFRSSASASTSRLGGARA
jgi:hypothetical protein